MSNAVLKLRIKSFRWSQQHDKAVSVLQSSLKPTKKVIRNTINQQLIGYKMLKEFVEEM